MNSRDRDQLLILLFIILFVAITIAFIFGTKLIPVPVLVGAIIVLKFLIIQPLIVKMYYSVHGQQAPFTRFIPLYNEIMVLQATPALALLISYISLIIAVPLLYLPVETIANILGEYIALNFGTYLIRVIAILLVINMFVYGFVMCSFMQDVQAVYRKFLHNETVNVFKIYSKFLLFVPLVRVVPLLQIYNSLFTLTKLNKFDVNNVKPAELKEEM